MSRSPHQRPRASRAFTLLELMISMAILAFSLVALLGHQSVAIQSSDYSNRASQASFLLEAKLLDVKHKILSDSVDVFDNCEEGDFKEEGFRDQRVGAFRWKVCAFKLEIQEGAADQLTERLGSLLMGFGGGGGDGSDPAGATGAMGAMGAMGASGASGDPMDPSGAMGKMMGQLAMATGAIPMFLQQLEDKIRKVRVEVSWRDQTKTRRVVVERFITALGADNASGSPPPEDNAANENQRQLENNLMNQGVTPPPTK